MIKIENVDVYGFESAIRGMRNPMNSWDKSDSCYCKQPETNDCNNKYKACCAWSTYNLGDKPFCIGQNDLKLMQSLVKAGSDHSKFMRMMNVTLDITAPLYWWKEFDTYKVGTVRNSCSTMHKIHSKEFTLDDFSIDDFYFEDDVCGMYLSDMFKNVVADCEFLRKKFVETGDKKYWRGLIQLLPESYNQRATVQLNYAVLRNMYHSRKNHKLDCWRTFCEWIETLPYAKELICGEC